MNNYEKLGLYAHNIRSYEKVKEQLNNDNIAAIVHATGTGKSFNALQLALDNKDKKIIYVVPYSSIIEHEKELIEENENVSLEKDFPNLEFRTYQSFINMSEDEIARLDVDLLILDEFHHIGAPIWGSRVNTLVETHENLKIFGMTAYTVRDRGTSYERDMVNPQTDELFSNKVVSKYDLCDAMIDGILPKPTYKSGYVYLERTCEYLETKINSLNQNSKEYKELYPILNDIKKRISEAPEIKEIFKKNIKPNGKYIYFCPLNPEQGVNDMVSIMEEAKVWIKEMGLTEDQYELYMTTGEMGEEGKKNRNAFYRDEDLEQKSVKDKLRIMFAINQYNEGVHVPKLDGVIFGRTTQSDIIFFEQLGRALSVSNNKDEYNDLMEKSNEELIALCKERELDYKEEDTKEMLVEILLAPTIIDLSNNIGFIKKLENNLKDKVKEITSLNNSNKREIHLNNATFNIEMLNEDVFKVLEYMRDRLTMTWEDKYELAKKYYEHYGDLEITDRFKTINGIDYDENGISLGYWITFQRKSYLGNSHGSLTKEQIELLKNIGMRFETNKIEIEWRKKYELAKKYYEHYGNLEIPFRFKTINGIDYDDNGIALGHWIVEQRRVFAKKDSKMTEEQIELLRNIGMRFETNKSEIEWRKKYELAKKYYEHYGDLEIPDRFKTINGIDYDENGVSLGLWILNHRNSYAGKGKLKITKEQIELLNSIGMRFEANKFELKWHKKYELAKKYYEHYGNLEIPKNFVTVNGIDYDENGVTLGMWILNQRQTYNGKSNGKLTEEQIKLLDNIGMKWLLKDTDKKLKEEEITEENNPRKQKELLNRLYSVLNNYNGDELPSKEEINEDYKIHL